MMQDKNDTTPDDQNTLLPSEPDTPASGSETTTDSTSSTYGSDSFGPSDSTEADPTLSDIAAATTEKEITGPPTSQNSSEVLSQPVAIPTGTKKKKWMIPAIVAGVLVLLGGTSAAAYNLWYQNPDKVLGDALVNTIRAKTVSFTGSFSTKSKGSSTLMSASEVLLTVDGKNSNVEGEVNIKLDMTYDNKKISLSGSGLYDKDANLYFKVGNVKKTIDAYADGAEIPKAYSDIITKIDNKWIKISADDIKEFSEDYADTQVCLKDTLKKLENDKAVTKEVIDVYDKNRFIEVKEKLGSKEGSLGYRIETNEAAVSGFAKGVNNTKLIKELQKCDDSFKLDDSDFEVDSSSAEENQFKVWVDRWSHQFTELTFTSKGDDYNSKGTIKPVFNKPVGINVPKDFMSLSELKSDIEAAFGETYGNIQDRANTSVAASQAHQIVKKTEAYNVINGKYPTLDELKSAQEEAALGSDLQEIITASEPTVSTSSLVQYVLNGPTTGGYVAYYDATTQTVTKIEFGVSVSPLS